MPIYIYIYVNAFFIYFFTLHYRNENCEAYVLMEDHENGAMQIHVMVVFNSSLYFPSSFLLILTVLMKFTYSVLEQSRAATNDYFDN